MSVDEQFVFEFDLANEGETVSGAVVEAVATVAETDPFDIEPLYSVVDPDALNTIFGREANRPDQEGDVSVTFSFYGYDITVRSYGHIHVAEGSN